MGQGMSSLLGSLPAPRHFEAADESAAVPAASFAPAPKKAVLPYGQRRGFVPRTVEDFGDGGAFPEIHVGQYPLDMGRKRDRKSSTLGMTVDGQGKSDFSAIVTYGKGKDTTVHTRYQDLVPKVPGQEGSLARPDDEDVAETEVHPLRCLPVPAVLPCLTLSLAGLLGDRQRRGRR